MKFTFFLLKKKDIMYRQLSTEVEYLIEIFIKNFSTPKV